MYLCDFHTHSQISHDSQAPLKEMLRAANERGLQELCVTDHCEVLEGNPPTPPSFDWATALEQYHQAQAAGGQTQLRLGLELGSIPYDPQAAREILRQGGEELDFVLGSLHNWIGSHDNLDFYFGCYAGNPQLCRQVVEHALEHTWTLVTRYPDCYDSLAHIIYPLRYIHRDGETLTLADYEDQVREIFREVARTDHALEVNTCRGTSVGQWEPLLGWFKDCGGKYVTVGSDAHMPEHMAAAIPQALALVQKAGFTHVTTFHRRRPVLHQL